MLVMWRLFPNFKMKLMILLSVRMLSGGRKHMKSGFSLGIKIQNISMQVLINVRRKKNQIKQIMDMDGLTGTDQPGIEQAFLNYYRKLFRAVPSVGMGECLSGLSLKITDEMNSELLKPASLEEVSSTLFSMGPFKASGSDGFLAFFLSTKLGQCW